MKTLLVSRTSKLFVTLMSVTVLASSCNSCGKKTHCDAYSSYQIKNDGTIVKVDQKRSDS